MTSYLGPESPRPFSVAAERYFQQINPATGFNIRPTHDRSQPTSRCRFGEQYEREFAFYLAKHAEVNCSDRLCLVGEESEWASIVQERLFLIKPVHFIDCKLHQDAIKEQLSAHTFDRIILLNCLHQVNNPPPVDTGSESRASNTSANSHLISFIHLLRKSLASQGKLVIIHREPNINTLPLPVEVITNWYDADAHSARLIEQLHRERKKDLELVWEMETIKFALQKLIWFNLLIHRTFYPLTLTSQKQIADGLRQLNETYFKYHQGSLEMYDRLLFLTIQNKAEPVPPKVRLPSLSQPSKTPTNTIGGRLQRKPIPPQKGPHEMWDYKMLVTDEVNQLLQLNNHRQETKRNLFKSSIDFM